MAKKKVRLGRVAIDISYVVDLDNRAMVNAAVEALFEDIMNAVKYDEVASYIKVNKDPKARRSHIPSFLAGGGDVQVEFERVGPSAAGQA